jgi:UDP-galactose-lipid carrier transferase
MLMTQLPVEQASPTNNTRQSNTHHVKSGLGTTPVLAFADVIALTMCLLIARLGLAHASSDVGDSQQFLATFMIAAAGVLCLLAVRMHYDRRLPFWAEMQHLSVVAGLAIVFSVCVEGLQQRWSISLVLLAWLPFPALALTMRALLRRELGRLGLWQIPTVLIGRQDAARETITALLSEPSLGYTVVARISGLTPSFAQPGTSWRDILDTHHAAMIILAGDPCLELGRDRVQSLVRERIPFAVMPQPAGLPVAGLAPMTFVSHDAMLILYRNNLARPISRAIKIAFDLVVAATGLLLAMPVFLIIAALVKLDGGPVFYSHTRIGAGASRFGCLKFRSMRSDADMVLQRLLHTDPAARAEWARTQKLRQDPRITRIGRILRSTSLDELPQLINVLRLEMSLVGPRPIVASELHHYGEDIAYYYETRPGMTGLWQVSGRTGTSYERRVQLDSWYVRNWSIWQDLAIMVQTVPAVLKRRGAI